MMIKTGCSEQKLLSPELGHSCRALAIRVLAMFFSPARNSNLTDSNLFHMTNRHIYMYQFYPFYLDSVLDLGKSSFI